MWFAIGFASGLAAAAIMAVVAFIARRPIQRAVASAERAIRRVDPEQRGYIFEPEDEAEVARKEIIEKNKKAGRDTPIGELM